MFSKGKIEDMPEAEFYKWVDGHEEHIAVVKFDSNVELETADGVFFREDGYIYQSSVMKAYNELSNLSDVLQVFSDDAELMAIITVRGKKTTKQEDDDSENVFVL